VDRRAFMTALAAGTAAVLSGCAGSLSRGTPHAAAAHTAAPTALPSGTPTAVKANPTAGVVRVPTAQPTGVGIEAPSVIDRLSDSARASNRFALTVDDGVSTDVLAAYLDFVVASGIRITFFVNGVYQSWTVLRQRLIPLIESGQVQLANHTWNHPSITGLTDREITDQLTRNEQFLINSFGVTGRPYFRPPYGNHDDRTDRITADLGYSRTVMWYGSLGDASVLTPQQVLANAKEWFRPGRVVIGHANHPAVTYIFPQLAELLRERSLQTVTLNDVYTASSS
jgi:peptidoglycan/xylan/chitin deacetylase (PgdA/CDA1 family)